MADFCSLEPAIDPSNRTSFMIDWELTMKCNLDCDYCPSGLYGGHLNSTKHPPLNECLNAIDFMFSYVDHYMKTKPTGIRQVIINVYGGEGLYHPHIEEILRALKDKHQAYKDSWLLTVTSTTNAIVSEKKLNSVIPYIDEFTVSYHSQNTEKHKEQFRNNLLSIARANKRQKCIVMMHPNEEYFQDACNMIEWLKANNIRYLPKQIDDRGSVDKFKYHFHQIQWFENLYSAKSYNASSVVLTKDKDQKIDLAKQGRPCCGGRQLCKDSNYRTREYYVDNRFPDWYCSVDHFFLYIKQLTGEIFVNKDCRMNYRGEVGPIANLLDTQDLLEFVKNNVETNTFPIIRCKKKECLCGLCAPKAQTLDEYQTIINKYQKKVEL